MRALALAASFLAAPALAGGFAITEQDAQATGRAGSNVGVSGGASAVHYNPAGLGFLQGVRATAGATAILPSARATNLETQEATNANGGLKLPPHAYAAYGFGDLSLGVGFNAPFGGGLAWPTTWPGRTELVEMSLQVLAGHLGGAYRLNREWSIGASATLYGVSVALDRRIDFVSQEGGAQLAGGGVGVAGALGVQWAPRQELTLGLMGRLPATARLSGRAHFSDVPAAFNGTLPDQAISTSLTLPGKLALGVDARLPWVRLVADVEYTFWSSFQSFGIDFEDPSTPDVNQPRNWQNAPTFRLGAERDFGNTTVRLGGVLDLAASPADTLSPSLPDSTRLGFSVGVGHAFGPVRGDLAYQFIAFLGRASSGEAYPAQYAANAHLIALSLAWLGSQESGSPQVSQR